MTREHGLESCVGIVVSLDTQPFRFQVFYEQLAELGIIVNQKNVHRRSSGFAASPSPFVNRTGLARWMLHGVRGADPE